MYVQLRSTKQVIIKGNVATCYPGDWVDVGKQTALNWIATGDAWVPSKALAGALPTGAGIFIRGDISAQKQITKLGLSIPVEAGDLEVPYPYTMLWDPRVAFPQRLMGAGFHLLERWQMVVPLWSYERLANTCAPGRALAIAKELLHDLRVPLYDTRLIFAKRSATMDRVMKRWQDWEAQLENERLAFLCAVYETKPVICALPALDRDPR